jgi:hypothetical protein
VKNGETTPAGWIAEHTSCLNPGSVSSAVLVPPPISSAASTRRVSAGAGQLHRGGEAIRTGADHGGVEFGHRRDCARSGVTRR